MGHHETAPRSGIRLRDPAARDHLDQHGYATIPMLGQAELERLRAGVDALRPADGFAPDGTGVNQRTYHCTFLDEDLACRREAAELAASVFGPALEAAIEGARILTSNLYVKPPGEGAFDMHQNWHTVDDPSVVTLTIWCPLHDVDVTNATIHVVPGSQQLVPDVAALSATPWFSTFGDELIERHMVPIPLRAGEAIVFHDTLLHWSPDNHSSEPRRAVQIELIPAGSHGVLYALDPDDPDVFEVFPADTDFYLTRRITDVVQRPPELAAVGRQPNPNRPLDLDEFERLLGEARARRASSRP